MSTHPTREEDFDLYALGALEADEKLAIESHVASCAACAEKLAEARGRISLLALAAPPVAPSAVVKERLMQRVRAAVREDEERSASAIKPVRTISPAPRPPVKSERTAGAFSRWWAAVLVPAAAVLAIATILLWTENRQLDRRLAALRAAAQQQEQQLAQARAVADLIESRDTITVALAQQPGQPSGDAHVIYNAKMGMLMYDGEIAPAPAAKSYQLWLVPAAGQPISVGVFNPVAGQPDHLLTNLPQGLVPKAFAVTLEPAGGMPQPTGPMVLVGPA
jgi:anti-sigma-K factor RskA